MVHPPRGPERHVRQHRAVHDGRSIRRVQRDSGVFGPEAGRSAEDERGLGDGGEVGWHAGDWACEWAEE